MRNSAIAHFISTPVITVKLLSSPLAKGILFITWNVTSQCPLAMYRTLSLSVSIVVKPYLLI